MRLHRVSALTALVGVALFLGAPACGQDCESVGCGGDNALVRWHEGAVPDAASYELCVDDVCAPAEPSEISMSADLDPDPGWQVGSIHGPADGESATVRLVLRDAAGGEVSSYEGTGSLSGECCRAVVMQVEGDTLVPEPEP